MVFNTIQLTALFLFIFMLVSIVSKNKILNYILMVIGMAFLTVQVSSVIFGNALFDYKYYVHINFLIFKNAGSFFTKEIKYLIGIFSFLSIVGVFFIWLFSLKLYQNKKWIVLLIFICFGLMLVKNGIVHNLKLVAELHFAKEKAFDEALENLGLQAYPAKKNIQASAGKNIIVLILESIEATFLDPGFAHLTPNLQKLANDMTYFKMEEIKGGDFTTGAIYTYLTGFPCFFKNHGNLVFDQSKNIKINSISDALSKAGYRQLYLMGNPEFAGTGKMLELFDIEVKSEKDYESKYTVKPWGLHDKDLFFLTKEELKKLKTSAQPFALFVSSISTHQPDGVPDERVVNDFPVYKSNLELMIASLDREIGQLINFLQAEDMLENTALFMMSDHLLMGTSSRILNDISHLDRNLFMMTNTQTPSYKNTDTICQIDVGKMILEGANVQHNLLFLTDFASSNKVQFIEENQKKLVQLNEASLSAFEKKKKPEKIKKVEKNENTLYMQSNSWQEDDWGGPSIIYLGEKEVHVKRGVNIVLYDDTDASYEVENYDTYGSLEAIHQLLAKLKMLIQNNHYFLILIHDSAGGLLRECGEELKAMGLPILSKIKNREAYIALSDKGISSEVRKRKQVELSLPLIPQRTLRPEPILIKQATNRERIIAHAGGKIDGITYTNCLEALNLSYKKGFRLFEIDLIKTKDERFVGAHDWESWKRESHYYGSVPPTEAEFLSYKVHKKFTPINMDSINNWFANHPDAVLITDKVNEPEAFISAFKFPGRLIMELFSFEAVEKAQDMGVNNILLSENMWDYLGKDKLQALQDKGISKMAISRRTIEKNPAPYKALADAGIKIYAFHVNFDDFRDEHHMLRTGLDFCYGFYADDWHFKRFDDLQLISN